MGRQCKLPKAFGRFEQGSQGFRRHWKARKVLGFGCILKVTARFRMYGKAPGYLEGLSGVVLEGLRNLRRVAECFGAE